MKKDTSKMLLWGGIFVAGFFLARKMWGPKPFQGAFEALYGARIEPNKIYLARMKDGTDQELTGLQLQSAINRKIVVSWVPKEKAYLFEDLQKKG